MCDTLRNPRRRGRSGVPLIRFRWRSEIRLRRSLTVFIFIALSSRLSALGSQLSALSHQPSSQLSAESRRLIADSYFAPVLPAFFFKTSPVYRTPFCL